MNSFPFTGIQQKLRIRKGKKLTPKANSTGQLATKDNSVARLSPENSTSFLKKSEHGAARGYKGRKFFRAKDKNGRLRGEARGT